MRSEPDRKPGWNGARILAMGTALVVHGSALLLLLVPERPALQARALDAATEAIFLVPPPKPPPPPPIVAVKPMPLLLRPSPRPQSSVRSEPSPATLPAPLAPPVVSDNVSDQPPIPPGPELPAVSAARVDARYGRSNRLKYPLQALRQREQGRLKLRVLIASDGSVQKLEIVHSSGSPRLDQAALQSVRQWRFVAAQRDGQGFAAWVIVPVEFSLGSG